jgi:hypothetical protein
MSYLGAFPGLRSSCIMFWFSLDIRNLIVSFAAVPSVLCWFLFRGLNFVAVHLVWKPFLSVLQKCFLFFITSGPGLVRASDRWDALCWLF